MIQFIADTPKGRIYKFSTQEEADKFRLFWQMGIISEIKN